MSRARFFVVLAATLSGLLTNGTAGAQSLPAGFTLETVVSLPTTDSPVGFTFLPDGRIVLLDQNTATVRISIPGSGMAADIHTIPDVATLELERGLQGVAVDPGWPTRPYLYFYYNHTGFVNYVTMYTVSGDITDPGSTNLVLSSPFHLLTDIPDIRAWHNGGTLRFGPDGMLFLSLGDDGTACNSQSLVSLSGSMLRLDVSGMPGVGTGPPAKADITPTDNPFPGPDENAKLIYAWGLRNPFRFTIDGFTGDLFVADVGLDSLEEIDQLVYSTGGGGNYGWPQLEGTSPVTIYGTCGTGNPFVDPIYTYPHDANAKSVTGGPLYHPVGSSAVSFPASYDGSYFLVEFYEGWVRRLVKSGGSWVVAPPVAGQPSPENWGEGILFVTDFQVGPDGALYLARLAGPNRGLYRVLYTPPSGAGALAAGEPFLSVSSDPNPATPRTGVTIRYALPRQARASLRVVDVSGRVVRTLAGGATLTDHGSVHWDGRADDGTFVPAGVYFYRLEPGGLPPISGKISLLH